MVPTIFFSLLQVRRSFEPSSKGKNAFKSLVETLYETLYDTAVLPILRLLL